MKLGTVVLSAVLTIFSAASANASQSFTQIFTNATGWQQITATNGMDLNQLNQKAEKALNNGSRFQGLVDDTVQFSPERAVGDEISTTIKFTQTYQGLEVVGEGALVHFDRNGQLRSIDGDAIKAVVNVQPKLSATDVQKILNDRYAQKVKLGERTLKVYGTNDGKFHLAYHVLTRTTETHMGQSLYLDAHTGAVLAEFPRMLDFDQNAKITAYRADTEEARKDGRVDESGNPTDINFSWYKKVAEDGQKTEDADDSSIRAYKNAGHVYDYYMKNFHRASFDGQNARLNSIAHVGKAYNNAFWTDEFKTMAYGDGDGEKLVDLTLGLDVAAHEMTHAVTASTAKLEYNGESGALNESFSDFFGKMVDYKEGDWLIGATVVGPKLGMRAIRNMKDPSEMGQPDANDSPKKTPTDGFCWRGNDYCGVHKNSGIPNRAGALIVEAIGKQKAEHIYFKVLTEKLKEKSTFADARKATVEICAEMFGEFSNECMEVTKAFNTVKM